MLMNENSMLSRDNDRLEREMVRLQGKLDDIIGQLKNASFRNLSGTIPNMTASGDSSSTLDSWRDKARKDEMVERILSRYKSASSSGYQSRSRSSSGRVAVGANAIRKSGDESMPPSTSFSRMRELDEIKRVDDVAAEAVEAPGPDLGFLDPTITQPTKWKPAPSIGDASTDSGYQSQGGQSKARGKYTVWVDDDMFPSDFFKPFVSRER
ncbi:hypothetical protein QBC42DRAFT_41075 [Cladorrhinum samala]|uniref:Uncharacterized protein n=1 Tax=Cladorrhinum samala TaxID=585594 RepID=A0AAV9HBI5_9PEZI|nr:hypothetical protein QBC42DRAFT_41075 [Cladorrhinum samala]